MRVLWTDMQWIFLSFCSKYEARADVPLFIILFLMLFKLVVPISLSLCIAFGNIKQRGVKRSLPTPSRE